eukprot:TRINITY_DN21634_c0_g1_i1.p1 TRINITY_DN21634_c0_g1~~TRINITY_DN21634_c0_g1_i1.p1  ORF type:complete len:120 (-),score=10.70 TRINITY_DN21634_c0_g1_i1:383-742(-)
MARSVSRDARSAPAVDPQEQQATTSSRQSRRQRRQESMGNPSFKRVLLALLVTSVATAIMMLVVYYTQDRMVSSVALQIKNAHHFYENAKIYAKVQVNTMLGLPPPTIREIASSIPTNA